MKSKLVLLFALFPVVAFAQDAASPVLGDSPWSQLVTPFVALAVAFIAKKSEKLPGWALPVIAAFAGLGYDLASAFADLHESNPLLATLLGLAATGLHQIRVQLKSTKP